MKFNCPHCQQHIEADQGYAGMQLACPACGGMMVVPGAPVAQTPVPAQAPAQQTPRPPPPPVPATGGCPSCGNPLPRGAVLCTHCGYNLATKQRTVAGRRAAPGKPATPQHDTPWHKTPYPYVGAVVVALCGLYFLGKENNHAMLAFYGLALVYLVAVHIIVVIAAFQESAGTGFLTLCLPFYALYFVFKVSENETLKVMYAAAAGINIAIRFIPGND